MIQRFVARFKYLLILTRLESLTYISLIKSDTSAPLPLIPLKKKIWIKFWNKVHVKDQPHEIKLDEVRTFYDRVPMTTFQFHYQIWIPLKDKELVKTNQIYSNSMRFCRFSTEFLQLTSIAIIGSGPYHYSIALSRDLCIHIYAQKFSSIERIKIKIIISIQFSKVVFSSEVVWSRVPKHPKKKVGTWFHIYQFSILFKLFTIKKHYEIFYRHQVTSRLKCRDVDMYMKRFITEVLS